ncbi:extracellular calcium-sensing receptor-like, partial [Clarias magur]
AAMALMNGKDRTAVDSCSEKALVQAIIGESESTPTIALTRTTGPFKIPVISHAATCECLSSRKEYPSFFRTIASDYYQSRALAFLVKHFGWSWVGAVNSDNDYGNNGIAIFLNAAKEEGICVEYSEKFDRFNLRGLRLAQTMTFTIDEINSNNRLLPNISISYAATCECLSNRKEYPSFFRTIASDYYQSRALAFLVKNFGWSWVGAVNSDNDYGNNGMAIFLNAAKEEGICVEYSEKFDRADTATVVKVVDIIKKGTAKVIILFLAHFDMNVLVDHLIVQNVTGYQMIGVEAWITAVNLAVPESYNILAGSIGFDVGKFNIARFADYVVNEFWQRAVPCLNSAENISQTANNCSKYEDMIPYKNYNEDISELRYAINIYNGVYAVAHSLQSLLKCTENQNCRKDQAIQPWQVVESLKKVHFTTTLGEQIWFDSTGATAAKYDVVNWQRGANGEVQFKVLGYYDASLPTGKQFVLNVEDIMWAGEKREISYAATCECLSNRKEYPSFFRTIASDFYQSRALAYLVKHFGWSWVGAVYSDNDYGNNGMAIFLNAAKEEGICVEYSEKFFRSDTANIIRVTNIIKEGTAKVIILFLSLFDMNILIEQLILKNVTGYQMIGVEAWITAVNLATPANYKVLAGSIGFDVGKLNIDRFADYVVHEFWKTDFPCLGTKGNISQSENDCSNYEDIIQFKNYSEDISELRYAKNIYNAVYAVAHSLHSLLGCTENQSCKKNKAIQSWQ